MQVELRGKNTGTKHKKLVHIMFAVFKRLQSSIIYYYLQLKNGKYEN